MLNKISKETLRFLQQGALLPDGHGICMTNKIASEILDALGLLPEVTFEECLAVKLATELACQK